MRYLMVVAVIAIMTSSFFPLIAIAGESLRTGGD